MMPAGSDNKRTGNGPGTESLRSCDRPARPTPKRCGLRLTSPGGAIPNADAPHGEQGYNGYMSIDRPVTIIGGHGKVALRAARILSGAGAEVFSVIRNPDQEAAIREAGATPVVADVENLDVDGLREVVRGSGSVVFSAGAGGGNPERTYAVDRDAAIRTIDASGAEGVERFVMVSYDGARPDHGVPEDNSFFPYAEAKAAADSHLRESDLQWTILGPGALTDEPGGDSIGVGAGKREDRATSRDVVAAVIAEVLRRPDTARRTIEFSDGDTPIGEALTRK